MVGSIDPKRGTLRLIQWPSKVATVFGTRAAETILASGYAAQIGRTYEGKRSQPHLSPPCEQGAVHI